MPVQIIRNDITRMHVDAIVSASNNQLTSGSGVNGAIHKAAGPQLLAECQTLGGCKTGEAKITRGYDLPARYVIHTVGPVWRSGWYGEEQLLSSCYRSSLELAQSYGLESIAFPLISSGVYGYPKDQAMKIAMDAIRSFLMKCEDDMMVYLVVFNKEVVEIGSKLYSRIEQFIDDHYVDEHTDFRRRLLSNHPPMQASKPYEPFYEDVLPQYSFGECEASAAPMPMCAPLSLEDELDMIDESFSQMVLRRIAEKGMKNAECYKKANLDKKLFSKINNDIHYKPKKTTALALAIALEMDLEETKELLMKAGLALSRSDKFDIIVEYFIREKKYDIFELNEVLFYYDQPLLGCVVA